MAMVNHKIAALTTVLLVAGCSNDGGDFGADALWPSLDSQDTSSETLQDGQSVQADGYQPLFGGGSTPPASSGPIASAPVSAPIAQPASSLPSTTIGTSGTHVGLRIKALQQDLARLQSSINLNNQALSTIRERSAGNANQYQNSVAPLYARLQVGTTPGNPVLTQQLQNAELRLNRLNDDVDALNSLANSVASDAASVTYLADSTRAAYGLSGAFEEDHRQLAFLEDEVNRTAISVDRLLTEVTGDISRQGNYVAAERANLTALILAVKTGSFFDSLGAQQQGMPTAAAPMGSAPLAVIQFDRANLRYQNDLTNAARQALARNPNARFDIVGVASSASKVAENRRQAEGVYRTIARLGVPANRLSLTTNTGGVAVNEVHVFAR